MTERSSALKRVVTRAPAPVPPPGFRPARVVVVDEERPVPLQTGATPDDRPYEQVWILARRAGRPLGLLPVDLADGPVPAGRVATLIEERWPGTEDGAPPPRPHRGTTRVSVIVPTCRRPHDLERCVVSVLATGYPELEVLVVDNAPDDPRTAAAVATVFGADARVRYLVEDVPGASRARNRGIRAASGDVLAFVDDDIVVDPGWLDALTAALDEHPLADCVTGLVVPLTVDTPVHAWFESYGGFDRGYQERTFDLGEHRGETLLYPYTAGSLGGLGNAAFRRRALQGERPFDVTLGPGTPAFGAEDQDVLLRVLRSCRQVVYDPAAIAQHRHRDTYAELRWQVFTYSAGFVAALIHWALHQPGVAKDLLRRVPPLLPVALGRRRGVDTAGREGLPPGLRRLEQLGYLYGPVAYALAVRARRRIDRRQPAHRP